ncbi:MAG: hypothetical protein RID91_04685, partial [Azospirillaceae bacterium]
RADAARVEPAPRSGGPALSVVARAPAPEPAAREAAPAIEPAPEPPPDDAPPNDAPPDDAPPGPEPPPLESDARDVGDAGPPPALDGEPAGEASGDGADETVPVPPDFRALVRLFERRGDPQVHAALYNNVHLVRYEPGRLEYRPDEFAPAKLAQKIGASLQEWTGRRWMISISDAVGEPPLKTQDKAAVDDHPVVKAVLARFPGAKITSVHDAEPEEGPLIAPAEPVLADPDREDDMDGPDGYPGDPDGPEAMPFDPDED